MLVVNTNWRLWMAGMAVSLAIFGVVFFTVIKPSSDTANQAIDQAKKQFGTATSQAGSAAGQAGAVATSAQTQLTKASKLTACLSHAGTDVGAVQACQVKFGQ